MLKNKAILLFFLLLFIFRLALVLQNLMWFQDTANDQFFAVKILDDLKEGNILVKEGITNSGLNTRYPPFYTYLLAIIRAIHNSYEATLAVHIALSFWLLILVYKIARLLSSDAGGLVAFTIAFFSPLLIEASTVVYSAYFPLPFAFFSLYLLLKELLTDKPRVSLVLIAIFIITFMTTFSYALGFQVILTIVFILIYEKTLKQKFIYLFATFASFITFNLNTVSKYPIFEFLKTNFDNLFFPDKEVYRPGIYQNLLQQFYNNPELTFATIVTLTLLILYFIKSQPFKGKKEIAILVLFVYWLASSVIISGFGQFYKGVFAYPILYIVVGCFVSNLAGKTLSKKTGNILIIAATFAVFIVIPGLNLPRFRNLEMSHYNLSKNYITNLINQEDTKTLFLLLQERNNRIVYWASQSIWYFDYLVRGQDYELFPSLFCPTLLEGECYRTTPDKIKILCPTQSPEIDIFDPVKKSDCTKEAERLNSLVGAKRSHKLAGSFYEIVVDKIKYGKLEKSLLY